MSLSLHNHILSYVCVCICLCLRVRVCWPSFPQYYFRLHISLHWWHSIQSSKNVWFNHWMVKVARYDDDHPEQKSTLSPTLSTLAIPPTLPQCPHISAASLPPVTLTFCPPTGRWSADGSENYACVCECGRGVPGVVKGIRENVQLSTHLVKKR